MGHSVSINNDSIIVFIFAEIFNSISKPSTLSSAYVPEVPPLQTPWWADRTPRAEEATKQRRRSSFMAGVAN